MKKIINTMLALAATTFVLTACEDVPEPYPVPTPQPEQEIAYTGDGTQTNPYTCADAIKYVQALGGEESESAVYVKGIVASVTEEFTTQYGNGTFTISDDGTTASVFTAYRVYYLGNKKFASGNAQIKVGDEVVVCGNVVNYRGNTPETVQGTGYLYALNGVTEGGGTDNPKGEATGSGTQSDPYNVARALQVCEEVGETGTTTEVYAKGIVTSISEISTSYGNGTFIISDDASAGNKLTVYRAYSLGGEKFASESEIKVGDEVVICGKLVNFRGNTPEFTQGSYIYSINGKTEKGDDTPDNPSSDVKTVSVADFNAAAESNDVWYQLTGTITNIRSTVYGNFYLQDATGEVYVYGLLREKGSTNKKEFEAMMAEYGIKEGSTITIIGNRGSYNGTIEVMNAYFVSVSD